jgi:hypothetical protein
VGRILTITLIQPYRVYKFSVTSADKRFSASPGPDDRRRIVPNLLLADQ